MALGEDAGAQAGDDVHRVVVEAAQAGPDDVGGVGGVPVDDAGGRGLVAEAGQVSRGDRAGAQREDADPAAAGLGPQRLAEGQGDPLSEAVCWNGFWLLVTSGELPAAQFTDMVCRRLQAGGLPEVGIETLLARAVEAADAWAPPRQRAGLREQIAAATRTAAGNASC